MAYHELVNHMDPHRYDNKTLLARVGETISTISCWLKWTFEDVINKNIKDKTNKANGNATKIAH